MHISKTITKNITLFLIFMIPVLNAYPYKFTKLIEEEASRILQDLQQQTHVQITGISVPSKYGFTTISLMLNTPCVSTIADGRQKFINVSEHLLSLVNQSKKLRPLMKSYPLKPSDLDISLFFDNNIHQPSNLWGIHLVNSEYLTYTSPDCGQSQSETILTETYEEALAKVEEMKNNVAVKLPQE